MESRSSSPIRLPRDRHTSVSNGFDNLYPIGEGAGYAGKAVATADATGEEPEIHVVLNWTEVSGRATGFGT